MGTEIGLHGAVDPSVQSGFPTHFTDMHRQLSVNTAVPDCRWFSFRKNNQRRQDYVLFRHQDHLSDLQIVVPDDASVLDLRLGYLLEGPDPGQAADSMV